MPLSSRRRLVRLLGCLTPVLCSLHSNQRITTLPLNVCRTFVTNFAISPKGLPLSLILQKSSNIFVINSLRSVNQLMKLTKPTGFFVVLSPTLKPSLLPSKPPNLPLRFVTCLFKPNHISCFCSPSMVQPLPLLLFRLTLIATPKTIVAVAIVSLVVAVLRVVPGAVEAAVLTISCAVWMGTMPTIVATYLNLPSGLRPPHPIWPKLFMPNAMSPVLVLIG
ncbi:hypothetical protein Hdeb2414_s0021g00569891 [Helianthus debilis subsp. tardiflorus]